MKPITESDIKVLFSEESIQNRIREIAEELNQEYSDEEVYVVCVLKGSIMFTVDLIKSLRMPLRTEFIRLSSYGSNYTSTGKVNAVDISLPDLNGKNVLIIEDIIDTGHTAEFLMNFIKHNFKTESTKFISLLDKRCKREVDINPDIYGFTIDDKFLVGYGLDYDGYYRNLRYVGYVEV
ncbi:MAG: hypoxanthine phosphoribosyltransferase [Candidatus Gastranaerophilales bacterium]|nr:hypoxanthine phosphoribosyltransferase [Candidatus Gastranaerophilales bacterium]